MIKKLIREFPIKLILWYIYIYIYIYKQTDRQISKTDRDTNTNKYNNISDQVIFVPNEKYVETSKSQCLWQQWKECRTVGPDQHYSNRKMVNFDGNHCAVIQNNEW